MELFGFESKTIDNFGQWAFSICKTMSGCAYCPFNNGKGAVCMANEYAASPSYELAKKMLARFKYHCTYQIDNAEVEFKMRPQDESIK